ncbi:MAG: STAS domain-containing protein [Pleurocapsa sp. MO_226.B13]|nr:STAS domain-containing protein [Pleurocapsa sp. MO_226.B13]
MKSCKQLDRANIDFFKITMEIKTENYKVAYDEASHNIIFDGSLRLNGSAEYASITELLNNVAQQEPEKIVLDLKELNFLNSSGISVLSKFVINVRRRKNIQMVVIGAKKNPWQGKSLKNLQRLMPSLKLEME